MADKHTETFEIAIIGLGPVGATLANLLGQMGVSTVVLELSDEISPLPRAVAFDDEVMRIFQSFGLSDAMEKVAEVGEGAKFVDTDNKTLVYWERPMVRSSNGWFVNYRFNQPELEKILRDSLARLPSVSIKLGSEVVDLKQIGEEVEIVFVQGEREQKLRAAYVVGCDGGRSFVRQKMSVKFEDLGFHEEWLIIDLLLPERDVDPDRFTYHYCGFPRTGSKVFVGSKRKRWELRMNEADDRKTIQSPDVIWDILKPWIKPPEAEIERTALYTFHSTIAEKWRTGRVFLAGDAAHQTPPFMAQGMCAGIRDASNLAWKLEQVLRQGAPDQLLDTYESERSPHVREYINMTIEFGNLINNTAKSVTSGNPTNIGGGQQTVAQLRPKLGLGISAGDTSKRGRLLPQFLLENGRLLDDVTGYRCALLLAQGSGSADKFDFSLLSDFSDVGVQVIDAPGHGAQYWLEDADAVAVLVGADRNVIGTARAVQDIAQLHPSNWLFR